MSSSGLFSMFDPTTSSSLSLNWLSLMIILLIPSNFWKLLSKPTFLFKKLLIFFAQELKLILGKRPSSEALFLVSIFFLLLFYNFCGLFPYVFTPTSHLAISMSLGIPFWLGYMVINLKNNTSSMLAHLVPVGSPVFLAPFMVLIEIVSNLMRPLTLSVRLAANMVAGHLILALMSMPMASPDSLGVKILLVLLVIMLFLELSVAFIQSYVFMVLSSLYLAEVGSVNNK